ncbi:MAG TPA: glucose-1-phosphate thymidylyltransferase [Bacteroidetes bacterium]|nr:glucose-1-phosphate thymidylyltransferase [Bacteroidota bacterium]
MRNIILFDNETRDRLLPFTYTRPVCEIRVGILKIREKWEKWLHGKVSFITQEYLSEKYDITISERNYLINGSVIPNQEICSLVRQMEDGEAMLLNGELIAAVLDRDQFNRLMYDDIEELSSFELNDTPIIKINNLWDIFLVNDQAIRSDFDLLTKGRKSQPVSSTNKVLGQSKVFIEQGAKVECAVLNAEKGPVYIGRNAEVMEGSLIRGPFVLGEGSVVKMGAKIYGPTSIGPKCTVGGEIKNTVIFGNSNKGHEGYLGNSVIGEWCNLGADTNCSNLKNNWSEVKVWDYVSGRFAKTGQLKAGLFMGDHSMAGINTMFNTGTVVGLCCNVFGANFPRNFIPSFSWGGKAGITTYDPSKAFEAIDNMMKIHGSMLSAEDRLLLLKVFEESAKYRPWESEEDTSKKLKKIIEAS